MTGIQSRTQLIVSRGEK